MLTDTIVRGAIADLTTDDRPDPFAAYRFAVSTTTDTIKATDRDTGEELTWIAGLGWSMPVVASAELDDDETTDDAPGPTAESRFAGWWDSVCRLYRRFSGGLYGVPDMDDAARAAHAADRSAWTYAQHLARCASEAATPVSEPAS